MTPLLVVQNNLVEHLTAPLAIAAHERGIVIHDISSRDDMSGIPPYPAGLKVGKVLVFGSIHFVHQWAHQHPELSQWVFWSPEAQSAAAWSRGLGPLYHNHVGWVTTPAEVALHETAERHYRPMTTTKKIVGSVMTPDEMAAVCAAKEVPDDFPMWSSEPLIIDAEVRVWIIDGEIATYSMYRHDGAMTTTQDNPLIAGALQAAEIIGGTWAPARHFVCDVGLVDGEWGLIEFNPIHSSGWYAADPGAFLDAYFKAA